MEFLKNADNIAYLGPGGSYTEMAKDFFCNKFHIGAYQQPMKTIRQVIEFVDNTPNSLGVLPIENLIEGTVRETIDNLVKTNNTNITILCETLLPIHHCLLSKTTELYSISGIISHPQALAQCQNFIHNNMPMHLNLIEATSTAEAARLLDNYNLTYAAIGSEKTAELYNLNILKENINDDPNNKTRFILIGDFEPQRTENDKTGLAFSTNNEPGALLSILKIFQNYNINLSYIDSRPSKVKFGDYMFFVDFDGHIQDEKIRQAVEEVKAASTFFRFVGSYLKHVQ